MSPTAHPRLRQIAFLAGDLAAAEQSLVRVFGTEVIYRDPKVAVWGLQNFLVPIGGDILEVVSPVKEGTSGDRFLKKRGGDCGYMIIMQSEDAAARRELIESRNLAKVVFTHTDEDESVLCVQYSPKGIPGGMMPELDSHGSPADRFGPWYPCGPDTTNYQAVMRRMAHLQLLEATCRLAPGKRDTESAAKTWETLFGIPRHGSSVEFNNARLRFTRGVAGKPEGLQSITVGVRGQREYDELRQAAQKESQSDDGRIVFLGIEWHFVHLVDQARSRI